MKQIVAWIVVAIALALSWGLAGWAVSNDIDTAIIVGGFGLFITFFAERIIEAVAQRVK